MIIWGLRSEARVEGYCVQRCDWCKKDTVNAVTRYRKRFSLFFVPVITYRDERTLHCLKCDSTRPATELQGTLYRHKGQAIAEHMERTSVLPSQPMVDFDDQPEAAKAD